MKAAPKEISHPVRRGKELSYALIVGINRYKNFDRLKTALNDATEVPRYLKAIMDSRQH